MKGNAMNPAVMPSAARDEILRAVRAALPPAVSRPEGSYHPFQAQGESEDRITRFTHSSVASGALVLTCESDSAACVRDAAADARKVLSLLPSLASTVASTLDRSTLTSLDLFVCAASVGVAENGALWFATADRSHRAAMFLAERVIIVVSADAIVSDMHEAYTRINVRATSFGSFVAGPSKTADIEQALVVGAHGPKELTVIISGT